MKALYYSEHGGPEVVRFGDLPDLIPGPGQVVVDVIATSVNAADALIRSGTVVRLSSWPHVPGRDFSGTVAAIGDDVTSCRIGDAVVGVVGATPASRYEDGAHAEAIRIGEGLVVAKPAGLAHLFAAAVALAGLSAMISIEQTLAVCADDVVLIHGGAGGVGSVAIQWAKLLGAQVIATARAENHDYVRTLGADQVIDYQTHDFVSIAPRCTRVLDTVGGEVGRRSLDVLVDGGRLACIAGDSDPPVPNRPNVTAVRPDVDRTPAALSRLLDAVAAGLIRLPAVEAVGLADGRRVHEEWQRRRPRGKVVFAIR